VTAAPAGLLRAAGDLTPAGALQVTADPALIRGAALMLPVLAVVAACAGRRPPQREIAAAVLATAWNLLALAGVNALAVAVGWWGFHAEGAVAYGLPVDLLLGWALLWGAAPVLLAGRAGRGWWPSAARPVPLLLVVAVPAWLDLAFMPLAAPVVVLGRDWLIGESAAIAAGLLPGLLLARWSASGTRLAARTGLQVVLAGGLGLVLPIALTGVWRQPQWALGLMAQVLAVPLLLGVSAVREFAVAGRGTPLPYDPPVRLVTTGPYSYVRNPMQVSMVAAYLLLAPFHPAFLGAAAVAFAYGAGLAAWHEGEQLAGRFGQGWRDHRRRVRPWVPRWRPALSPGPPASVYVAATCGPCSEVGAWIERRSPTGLRVLAAEAHPGGLRRITYEGADGRTAEGVAAVAHVLVHLHLGWALAGWALLLPGVTRSVQLCADAFGGGPRAPGPPPAAVPSAGAGRGGFHPGARGHAPRAHAEDPPAATGSATSPGSVPHMRR
jgi:protein-S-isoprenylcysteine O-methyltransferase Ste14